MRRLSLVLLVALAAGCVGPRLPAPPGAGLPGDVRVRAGGRVVSVPIEDYVLATIVAELSPAGDPPEVAARLYEVQAIVARSYAAANRGRHRADGYDLCDTTHCQLYDPRRVRTSSFAAIAREAVRRTRGVVLTYGDRVAEGLFHADCGGSTSDASAVWGGPPVPYLIARRDELPAGTHRHWTVTADATRLRNALNRDPRTDIGRHLTSIDVTARDAGGRPRGMTLTGERTRQISADLLRIVVNRGFGPNTLLSTRFSVRREGNDWLFDGTGFGHGVGLCQAGARARARQGDGTEDILEAYFAGTQVRSLTAAGAPPVPATIRSDIPR